MKEFLRQVAEHWFAAGNIETECFIFPNRRSLAFFRKYLGETVASGSTVPVKAPAMLTMNDFLSRAAGKSSAGRVSLLLKLYDCYKALNPHYESLDDFIFWGDVILSDFDDTDKYLADPRQLFTNVSDLKGMQDGFEYLSERQREAMERFINHFRGDPRLSGVNGTEDEGIKARFLQIWDILFELYISFNSSLDAAGMAYEGKVYRSLAERMDSEPAVDVLSAAFPSVKRFVFVGLNALCECERKVMVKMRDAGIASFCWDWSKGWISEKQNKSTVFMPRNIETFGQDFEPDSEGLGEPEINVLSVPSSVGQAKSLPSIFGSIASKTALGDVSGLGIDTAVVLPDENLLMPVLNSIPEEIADINVTMGCPMSSSEFFSLMTDVAALQLHLRQKDGEWYFYHRQVHSIFANSIFKATAGEQALSLAADVKASAQYYIPQSVFKGDPVLESIFKPVVRDLKAAEANVSKAFGDYLIEIVKTVAPKLRAVSGMEAELDFAREYYLGVNRLRDEDLPVLPATYVRLLSQLLSSVSVPFNGEPLNGLQIMGPLETRALDFRNLIILSANEGVFPRRSVSSSFIPPELRKAFGLPNYEYQDAVWAYYFYRMIMRAENVWLVYDSRSEGLRSGEESRYIKQLELDFGARLTRFMAKAPIETGHEEPEIIKTPEDVDAVRNTRMSASALQNYLYCPAKFYYHTVKKLKPVDEVAESLDAGMIGNVFHNTMCALYFGEMAMSPDFPMDRESMEEHEAQRQRFVTRDYIRSWMKRPDAVRARIRSLIKSELHAFEVSGRNLVYEDVVFQYVMKVMEKDLAFMVERGTEAFEVKGLELKRLWKFEGFEFIGYIDRLDSFSHDELRVVDYKTGKVEADDINIFDDNCESVVEKLFGPDNNGRPKIALQLFLYDMFVSGDVQEGATVANSIYSPANLFVSDVISVPANAGFISLMKTRLKGLLEEISNVDIPFGRTKDVSICSYCDFKNICGR